MQLFSKLYNAAAVVAAMMAAEVMAVPFGHIHHRRNLSPRHGHIHSVEARATSDFLSFNASQPMGLAFSPYTDSGGCMPMDEIKSKITTIANAGYQALRLYGVDCHQVANLKSAISGTSLRLFVGVFDLSQLESQVSSLISQVDGDWSNIELVSIGNEVVNSGTYPASAIAGFTSTARSSLQAAGYKGPVVAVDTFIAVLNNPILCDVSDLIAINAHCYFDGSVDAAGCGSWLVEQVSKVEALCSKPVIVTESGWPTSGNTIGKAIPNPANQATAVSSILSSMSNKVFIFTAFNDLWKDAGPDGVEQSWGILH